MYKFKSIAISAIQIMLIKYDGYEFRVLVLFNGQILDGPKFGGFRLYLK